jgi:hypothetical protein
VCSIQEGGERPTEIELSRRLRPVVLLSALLVLTTVELLFTAGATQATGTGKPVAWGCSAPGVDYGQCGVPSGIAGATAIAAGASHSLALQADGTVVGWGCGGGGNYGQCSVASGLSGVTAIAAGFFDSLALKGDGTVVAWGCNVSPDRGQCAVPGGLAGVTAIAAGFAHSLALKGDGTVVAWGCGYAPQDFGQCSVPGGLAGVTAIAAGVSHSVALKNDGTVVAWGCGAAMGNSGDYGQCNVPPGLTGVTAIAAADFDTLALKGDGTVVAWGCGISFGQCSVPDSLSGVTAIAASWSHSLALKHDGTVVAWGCGPGDYGQCSVPSSVCGVTAIAAGNVHSLALAKTCQTITFGPLAGKTFGNPDFAVSASASSGLPVSFAGSGSCTVRGVSVHLTRVGLCTVTASQPGDSNYAAAPGVSRTFSIVPAPCRVPKVVGKKLVSAKRTIAKRHCRTGRVLRAYSGRRKKGIVISQSRRPGRVLAAGSKINLVVSRGHRR